MYRNGDKRMLEDSIDILTKLMIQANFEKDHKKENLIRFCIKLLKVIQKYEWLWNIKVEIWSLNKRYTGTSTI